MINIYSDSSSPRLEYICKTLFENFLNSKMKIFTEIERYEKTSGIKINYSSKELDGIQIVPDKLLFEKEIIAQNPVLGTWKNQACFYYTGQGAIPFDILAASFFLISRYEEYLPFKGDKHGRFLATESFAFQNGFLEFPIVDFWIEELKQLTENQEKGFQLEERKYTCHSSIDVDSAYAYLGKGISRTIGGFGKDMLKLKFKNAFNRLSTILGFSNDPFDTYDRFQQIHEEHEINCIYFFLLADFGPQDINLPHNSPRLKNLIHQISEKNEVGIHPGFVSNYYPEKLGIERNRLDSILKDNIQNSRQHFLMLKFPETYRRYRQEKIQHDYTMGFSDKIGFRAGTSLNFHFYDLIDESMTDLICHPFALMDVTLNLYMNLSPEEAMDKINSIIKTLKALNGQFIPLWHNESISEKWHWQGWKVVYEKMIKEMAN